MDTNILLSALYSNKGASFKLLSIIDSHKFVLHISTTLIYEYEEILKQKSKMDTSLIDNILNYICKVGKKNEIFFLWRAKLKDIVDDFGVDILSPKEFLEQIGELK